MIRLTLLIGFISFLCVYVWKDWYKTLCALIVLMAVIQHPDMPTKMMGIQGLNAWNLLMLLIMISWFINSRHEHLTWNPPKSMTILFSIYIIVIISSFVRMIGDTHLIGETMIALSRSVPTATDLWSEDFINRLKWLIPGLLVFHGCNSKQRLYWGIAAICLFYLILALQVIKWMPISDLASGGGDILRKRGAKLLDREIGYHRVDIAMMLSGGFWALFIISTTVGSKLKKYALYIGCCILFLGLALTGGRTGYGTWLAVGIVLALIRWRSILFIIPIGFLMVMFSMPFVIDRLTQGFTQESTQRNKSVEKDGIYQFNEGDTDLYTVTAGRVIAWPFVFEKISEKPWFGYGRKAMQRTGITLMLVVHYDEVFPHPHNAYLELIFDNGIVLAVPVFLMFFLLLYWSLKMIKKTEPTAHQITGGVLASILIALLVASFGSQSFYPKEGAMALWCAVALMLKVKSMSTRSRSVRTKRRYA